jgi:hypothetical protein
LDGDGNYAGIQFAQSGNLRGSLSTDAAALYMTHESNIIFYVGNSGNVSGTECARISSDGTFRVKGAGTAGSTDAFQVAGTAPASAVSINSAGVFNSGTVQVSGTAVGSFGASKWFIQQEDSSTTRAYYSGPDASTKGSWEIYATTSTGLPVLAGRFNADSNFVAQNIGLGATIPTTSGTGITFPATQNASSNANTLDDYEEGTWTPSITFGGASTGITYSAQYGYYTKIGNVVYYYCSIQLTNKGSSTGDALVTGLPFTASSATALFPTGNLRSVTALTVTAPSYATATRSNSTINLLDNLLGTQQAITNSNFSNNTEFNVTGFYFV